MDSSENSPETLRKQDLVKGEIYFFSNTSWDSDYIESYDFNGKFPCIRKSKKNTDGWVFHGAPAPGPLFRVCALYCRLVTIEEKLKFYRIMKDKGIDIGDFIIPIQEEKAKIILEEDNSTLCKLLMNLNK